ncbi:hypothetical protein [Halosimplex salinum]|uniref:hypothetical protein n=1 Tax=Halosimplex salinum TaxID=1710538 RepID=UPI0019D2CCFF|nr:hypothetical protein [Halosimplex salinum]
MERTSSADDTASPVKWHESHDDEELHATLTDAVTVPEDEVLIGYHLLDGPLPFTTQVYHAPDDATPQATETYETQDLNEVSLLPADPQPLDTLETDARDIHYGTTPVGEPLAVTLVGQYDDHLSWTAYTRSGHPVDGHAGDITVACYCSGEIYDVPPGGTWARVVQVTPTDAVEPGTGVVVSWMSGGM